MRINEHFSRAREESFLAEVQACKVKVEALQRHYAARSLSMQAQVVGALEIMRDDLRALEKTCLRNLRA